MRKIPTLFIRDWDGNRSLVTREPNPDCNWVFAGIGLPYRKLDGTACLVSDSKLWKRYDAKVGRAVPEGFIAAQEADPETGHWPGWVPVTAQDKWHVDAWSRSSSFPAGTYELCGPKINGNPEGFSVHTLVKHNDPSLRMRIRGDLANYDTVKDILQTYCRMEGIVWHSPDGRMAQIKLSDFGIKRI